MLSPEDRDTLNRAADIITEVLADGDPTHVLATLVRGVAIKAAAGECIDGNHQHYDAHPLAMQIARELLGDEATVDRARFGDGDLAVIPAWPCVTT